MQEQVEYPEKSSVKADRLFWVKIDKDWHTDFLE
jgi:hypothetical protein